VLCLVGVLWCMGWRGVSCACTCRSIAEQTRLLTSIGVRYTSYHQCQRSLPLHCACPGRPIASPRQEQPNSAQPFYGTFLPPCRSHVDVLLLARTALGTALPQARRRISLSGLTEAVLGRGLDKSEQYSAWGARPLRPEQLLYAAADAHALVALYRELNRRIVGLDTPFWVSHFSGEQVGGAARATMWWGCHVVRQGCGCRAGCIPSPALHSSWVVLRLGSSLGELERIWLTYTALFPSTLRASPAGRLTDWAAFHPTLHRNSPSGPLPRRGALMGSGSSGPTTASVRRSSVSWRDRNAQRLAEDGTGAGTAAGGRSQTQQLDANLPYLLNTYLGRQLPQGGKAAVVRAAAAHTGRPESGQTPR